MKRSLYIINACFSVFGRKRASRYSFSGKLSLSSLCCAEDEGFSSEDSGPDNDSAFSNEIEERGLSFGGSSLFEFGYQDILISNGPNSNDDEMKTIKTILKDHGWNLGAQDGYRIDLDQFNIIRILNVLFEESSDADLALYFFRWSEDLTGGTHSLLSICRMLHILVSGNMNHRAVDLILHLVKKYGVKDGSYSLLVKLIYETCTERKVLETVYSMFVFGYIKENRAFRALELTYQMKHLGTFPSRRACKSLVKALLELNQLDLAWDLLKEMQNQGINIDASIISLFIHHYCREGSIDCGWKLLLELKSYGCKPDAVAFTIVIDSLCKNNYLKEATSILFKMKDSGVSSDSVTISSVIDGYCKVGQLKKAVNVLKIFNHPLNIFIYNSFISEVCTEGNMVKASEFFYEMSESGLFPDCISYSTMIKGFSKAGEISRAFQYLAKMLKRGIRPSVTTYTVLIDTFCKLRDMEMAECLFRQMIAEGLRPDVVAYNTLMDGYGKTGRLHKAFEFLDMMRSQDVTPDVVTYNTLIHGLILRGFVNEAKGILDELVRRGFSVDVVSCTSVIDGFSRRGNFEEAFLVWFYMTENGMKPDVVTCSALLNGYCREHRMEEAKVLFHKMLEVGLNPDLILYNTLVHGFCSIGDVNEAGSLITKMIEQGLLPNNITLRAFVHGFEKKRVHNPVESVNFKLQEILLRHGIHVDVASL